MIASIIDIQDVRFRWHRQDEDLLYIPKLVINRGEHLFIQGPSGSGKTTLLKLITGQIEPDQGEILSVENGFALGMVAILGVMIFPLPPVVLDLLLGLSVSLSLVIYLLSMNVQRALDLSSFPSILLILTLMRLALNVASTRLILGEAQAGQIIQSFGNVVVQGNYVVGFVVFIILTVINFVVITKGAGRIAEVAARFTLDAS